MEALAVEAMKTLLEENRARFFATLHQDCRAQLMIRDQMASFPRSSTPSSPTPGIDVVLSGVQRPRMNSIMPTAGTDLPPRTAGPDVDLGTTASAPRSTRVRTVL